jgi:hypothetical protein
MRHDHRGRSGGSGADGDRGRRPRPGARHRGAAVALDHHRRTRQEGLAALLGDRNATAVVTGPDGKYTGLVTIDTLVGHLAGLRTEPGTGTATDVPA